MCTLIDPSRQTVVVTEDEIGARVDDPYDD